MHRRLFLHRLGGAGAVMAGLSLLEACSPAAQQPASTTAPPTTTGPRGQITVAQGGDVVSLDPHKINDMISMSVAAGVYDTLLTRDASGAIAPHLATSWQAVDDQTWRFALRQDVTFHNGEKLTAETVKANWDRLKDPNSKTTSSGLQNVTGAKVVDTYTVDIVSTGPNPMVPARMCMFAGTIVPMQYLQTAGADALAAKPVGTGPYRFVEWVKDDHVTLEANPTYWGGPPKLQRVIFKPIPRDATRVAAIQTGEVDVAAGIPPESIAQLTGASGLRVDSVQGQRVMYASMDGRVKPFDDKRVRQAVNYAVDVDSIIKNVLDGNAQRIAGPIAKDMFGYDGSVKPYAYDPDKARALLTEAGLGAGFSITMNTPSGRYLKDKETAQAIAGYLDKVGIKVDLQVLEWANFATKLQNKGLAPLYYVGNLAWTQDADNGVDSFFRTGASQNFVEDEQINGIIKQEQSTTDQQRRLGL
ncbi:MAG TPA: ABC transporter substrate-binding protein, partial [Chloroflexota bacterium]|nr:ABC transporter substrate-binding protein [Chloroflexota bacterium]